MQICPASFPERRNVRKGIKKADSHESRLFVSRNVVGLLLGNNAEFDRSLYIAVQFCGSLVLAEGLDCLYDDTLAVDLDAFGSKSLSQVGRGDRTEDLALLGFGCDYQRQVGNLLGQSLSVSQDLGILVSTLFEVLCEDFLGGSGSCFCVALRNQVVVCIAGLYVNDVVGVTQFLDIFSELLPWFFLLFIISCNRLRRAG